MLATWNIQFLLDAFSLFFQKIYVYFKTIVRSIFFFFTAIILEETFSPLLYLSLSSSLILDNNQFYFWCCSYSLTRAATENLERQGSVGVEQVRINVDSAVQQAQKFKQSRAGIGEEVFSPEPLATPSGALRIVSKAWREREGQLGTEEDIQVSPGQQRGALTPEVNEGGCGFSKFTSSNQVDLDQALGQKVRKNNDSGSMGGPVG